VRREQVVRTSYSARIVVLTNLSADMWLTFLDDIAAYYLPGLSNSN